MSRSHGRMAAGGARCTSGFASLRQMVRSTANRPGSSLVGPRRGSAGPRGSAPPPPTTPAAASARSSSSRSRTRLRRTAVAALPPSRRRCSHATGPSSDRRRTAAPGRRRLSWPAGPGAQRAVVGGKHRGGGRAGGVEHHNDAAGGGCEAAAERRPFATSYLTSRCGAPTWRGDARGAWAGPAPRRGAARARRCGGSVTAPGPTLPCRPSTGRRPAPEDWR
jgi:hypothetical protein